MNKFFKLISVIGCLFISIFESFSQGPYGYYNDAITFSQTNLGGTARVQGMGGVQIGLGGDVSNIHSNPAGLGFFNRSEVSFSPSLSFRNASSRYLNTTTDVFTSGFSLDNLAVVFNRSKDPVTEGEWRGGSFGISFNRVNHLNSEFQYRATNPNTSIIDYFLDASSGIPENAISDYGLVGLAYESFLIHHIDDDPGYYETFIIGYPHTQGETVRTTGAQSQWNFSFGGNYADRIYMGGGIGIASLRFRNEKVFRENFVNEPLVNLLINEDFRVNGIGINGTLGIIVRPNDLFRFGVSIITPTVYSLRDESGSTMVTLFDGENVPEEIQSALIVSNYSLKTPMRVNAGAALFFGKSGFISGDVEYVNHRGSRFNAREFSMAEDNQMINDLYQPAVNVKLGGEYRVDILRFRAGAGYFSDPFANNNEFDRYMLNFSLGAGIRLPTFYVDLAVLNNRFNAVYGPYESTISVNPIAEISNSITRAVLTLGFNF